MAARLKILRLFFSLLGSSAPRGVDAWRIDDGRQAVAAQRSIRRAQTVQQS